VPTTDIFDFDSCFTFYEKSADLFSEKHVFPSAPLGWNSSGINFPSESWGPDLDIFTNPIVDVFSNLRQLMKNIMSQTLISIGSIKPLHEGIQGWFARLDELKSNN